jgi:hypothetical protein
MYRNVFVRAVHERSAASNVTTSDDDVNVFDASVTPPVV